MLRALELLAPARDADVAREAILHGADAVYIGAPSHGARAAAANSIADIARTVQFAHLYGAKVYVALNTIIFDNELEAVRRTADELYRIGADALIVQDMALLRIDIAPIALHASTQCDTRDAAKAKFLADCGFSQIVVARELSIDEIARIRSELPADVAIEAFVHGALCVSYSGDCQASCAAMGRSANRGECAQMCRQAYDLTDAEGNVIIADRHLMSLRDLCRLPDIEAMALAGVSSFKIEGRLKDAAYVKNTVGSYRRALDKVIAAYPDRFCRSSFGTSALSFEPDVNKSFNRGFTSYFRDGRPATAVKMASLATPKWVGEHVGRVTKVRGRMIEAELTQPLANGDGLGYFTPEGRFSGFRVNRADGPTLYAATDVDLAPGTELYRNSDSRRDALLAKPSATRRMGLDMELRRVGRDRLALEVRCVDGNRVEVTEDFEPAAARTPQAEARRSVLGKLGDTIYELRSLADSLGAEMFVPASLLARLRRKAVERLMQASRMTYRYDYRRAEDINARLPQGNALTYHDNVANRLAADFYRSHGALSIEPALETIDRRDIADGTTVMTTRYCLRRELGACLLSPDARQLPDKLYLNTGKTRFSLSFDCRRCRMHLNIIKKQTKK